MKKLISMLAVMAIFFAFTSCGNDEPVVNNPTLDYTSWYSNHDASTEHYLTFDLEKNDKGLGTVRLYKVQFKIGERMSPKLNIRIDAPMSRKGNVYTLKGTDITPYLMMGESGKTDVPASQFIVTDFVATIDVEHVTYNISFKCHGGEYKNSGTISSPQNAVK